MRRAALPDARVIDARCGIRALDHIGFRGARVVSAEKIYASR